MNMSEEVKTRKLHLTCSLVASLTTASRKVTVVMETTGTICFRTSKMMEMSVGCLRGPCLIQGPCFFQAACPFLGPHTLLGPCLLQGEVHSLLSSCPLSEPCPFLLLLCSYMNMEDIMAGQPVTYWMKCR